MIQKIFLALTVIFLISGCSILGFEKKLDVTATPIKNEITHPPMPTPVDLDAPRWYVVSEAIIPNPCKYITAKDGSLVRPSSCSDQEKLHPSWPVGYTYLDKFLDDMKRNNAGDIVFVATSIQDYELQATNIQKIKKYINELGEIVIYYKKVINEKE